MTQAGYVGLQSFLQPSRRLRPHPGSWQPEPRPPPRVPGASARLKRPRISSHWCLSVEKVLGYKSTTPRLPASFQLTKAPGFFRGGLGKAVVFVCAVVSDVHARLRHPQGWCVTQSSSWTLSCCRYGCEKIKISKPMPQMRGIQTSSYKNSQISDKIRASTTSATHIPPLACQKSRLPRQRFSQPPLPLQSEPWALTTSLYFLPLSCATNIFCCKTRRASQVPPGKSSCLGSMGLSPFVPRSPGLSKSQSPTTPRRRSTFRPEVAKRR